jgi:hypothetical protein
MTAAQHGRDLGPTAPTRSSAAATAA